MKPSLNTRLRTQSIYLLPNLFTTAALFCGFYAIVQAMNNRFEHAAIAIFVAMILDGLDGRVARMTHTQSAFGAEYDSLSDMVSFGVAPALVMYEWQLKTLSELGWIVSFIYAVGAALRLARFNTMLTVQDKRWFQGLPSPSAAALVAGLVWVAVDFKVPQHEPALRWVAAAVTLFAGVTMVTTVRYWSFKEINMRKSVPFMVIPLCALFLVLLSVRPALIIFSLFLVYAVSGYVVTGLRLGKTRHEPGKAEEEHADWTQESGREAHPPE